jgi:hypothetical protein
MIKIKFMILAKYKKITLVIYLAIKYLNIKEKYILFMCFIYL